MIGKVKKYIKFVIPIGPKPKNIMDIKRIRRFAGTIVAFSMLSAGTTGKISGTIADSETGGALTGANIIVEGTSLGTASTMDGSYYILNVPPGNYTVRCMMIGYGSMRMTDVSVAVDLTTSLDFELSVEAIQGAVVTVVAERAMVTRDLTASTAVIGAEEFQLLPVTELSEALELQAGFVDGHLRGGRSGEVAYWIDGVPVTDVYDGGTVVDVNKNAVDEMQVISGAFNAEYGQAMSGIVNIVTKDGSDDFGGSVTLYSGDFLSQHNNIFMNIDDFGLLTTKNAELSLHGAIIPDKLFFYTTVRNIYYQGALEGRRLYRPNSMVLFYRDEDGNGANYTVGSNDQIDSLIVYQISSEYGIDASDQAVYDSMYTQLKNIHSSGVGDSAYVPMNWNRKLYGQLKLIYKFSPTAKLRFSVINDDVTYQDYAREYRYNPDGILTRNRTGLTSILQFQQSLGLTTYYTAGLTQFKKAYSHRTYSKKDEHLYVHPLFGAQEPYSFKTGGTDNNVFSRNTTTNTFKFDLTSQVNRENLVKTGLEYRVHELKYSSVNLQPPMNKVAIVPILEGGYLGSPVSMDDSTIHSSSYTFEPIEASVYIQDKIEFDELIINGGFRIDYFDPKGRILADPSDPSIYSPIRPTNRYHDLNGNGVRDEGEADVTLAERQAYWYRETTAKWKISPRLGVSFPITDRGVIHFSYGHFFQVPRFELLYQNPDYDLSQGTGNIGVVGNADLKPEKTVSGELGLQQQLTSNLAVEITGYFRDIRDLTGTRSDEIILFGGSAKYSKMANSDFAYIRGLVLAFNMRETNGWSGSIDYTYQIAKGTASSPEDARNSLTNNSLPEIQIIPLDWDQAHTMNATATYTGRNFGSSFIAQMGTGLPYTPESVQDISSLIENSSRKPITWNVDMRAYYRPSFMKNRMTLFLRVSNLFDHLNQTGVYDDSGVADRTVDLARAEKTNPPEFINTIKDWYRNETFYSDPRRVEFGVTYDF